MSKFDDSFTQKRLKYFRWLVAVCLFCAFYFVMSAAWLELHEYGVGQQSDYAVYAEYYMGLTVILALPLWYHKIRSIRAFYKELDKIYGDHEQAKQKAIHDTICTMFSRSIKEIIFFVCVSAFLYYIVNMYIITPELKVSYISQISQVCNSPAYSCFNGSNLDLNFTVINTVENGSVP